MLLNLLVNKVSGNELTRKEVSKTILRYLIPIDELTFSLVNSLTYDLVTCES